MKATAAWALAMTLVVACEDKIEVEGEYQLARWDSLRDGVKSGLAVGTRLKLVAGGTLVMKTPKANPYDLADELSGKWWRNGPKRVVFEAHERWGMGGGDMSCDLVKRDLVCTTERLKFFFQRDP